MDKAIITVEANRFLEVHPSIAAALPDARLLTTLPLYVARPDDPGLAAVKAMPGVLGVTIAGDRLQGVLQGLDEAVLLGQGLLGTWAFGGVAPGEDYPRLMEEPAGVAAGPAICAAVNLSLTPPKDDVAPTLPGDPVNAGTWQVSAHAVPVVAAGNSRKPGNPFETVSPWGEPAWVLCVGATDDPEGVHEAEYSGRGSFGNPDVGPDVLAWGNAGLGWDGTSFAAGAVSRLLCLTRAWLLQVAANIDRLAGRPFGVPLVGWGLIDHGFPSDTPPAQPPWLALPVIGTALGAFDAVSQGIADDVAGYLAGPQAAYASRVLLETAAHETSPQPNPPLSAPSITLPRLQSYLDGLTIRRLMEILDASRDQQPTDGGSVPAIGDPAMFPPFSADRLHQLIRVSMPVWQFNYVTRVTRVEHRRWSEQ